MRARSALRRWRATLRDSIVGASTADIATMAYWWLADRNDRDVFLCSYPKSGRTWLRFLLTSYQLRLAGVEVDLTLENFADFTPNLTLFSGFRLRQIPLEAPFRRILGTHSELPWLFRSQLLIFLRRDLRDVLVSLYHHRLARGEIDGGIEEFLNSRWGTRHAIRYANRWNRWLAQVPAGLVLELSYERLHEDTRGCIADCCSFLGLKEREGLLEEAILHSSADRMRRVEARWGSQDFTAEQLRDNESAFQVRRAEVGGHRHELSAETLGWLNRELRGGLTDTRGYDY